MISQQQILEFSKPQRPWRGPMPQRRLRNGDGYSEPSTNRRLIPVRTKHD